MMEEKNDLFDFEADGIDEANQFIKEAKEKSMVRIVATSLGVALGVLVLALLLKIQVTPLLLEKKIQATHMYHQLYGANRYVGQWEEHYDLIYSTAQAPMYKIVDGIVVPVGELSIPTRRQGRKTKVTNEEGEVYGVHGERMMLFYHPALVYDSYRHDLEVLKNVGEEKVIELALSFDKAYSFEEVSKMLPEGVTLQWSWVDYYDEEALTRGMEGISAQPWMEDEVLGMKSFNGRGEKIEDPEEKFLMDLEIAIAKDKKHRETYETVQERVKQKATKEDSVKVLGVVVAGTKEALSGFEDAAYMRASSFGAIVEKY